jgi:tRNA (guanine-N7-)-methyltransferase
VAFFAARKAKEAGLENVCILCGNAEHVEEWFAPGEVAQLFLNFSDPWPKARHAKRRLTHHNFLARYEKLLASTGTLRFKTDNRALFDFSLEEFRE